MVSNDLSLLNALVREFISPGLVSMVSNDLSLLNPVQPLLG